MTENMAPTHPADDINCRCAPLVVDDINCRCAPLAADAINCRCVPLAVDDINCRCAPLVVDDNVRYGHCQQRTTVDVTPWYCRR